MLTFKQVKKQAKKGMAVYLSSQTCWWTHDPTDLKEAKEMFQRKAIPKFEAKKKNEVDFSKRDRIDAHIREIKNIRIPIDPSGAPLYQGDLIGFLRNAKANSDHYGKYGLRAFMSAHHQNCNGMCYPDFSLYPVPIKPVVGAKGYHRYFGWCEITVPKNKSGKLLVNSEFDVVEVYQIGKGWKRYEGEEGEKIVDIYLPADELYEEETKDFIQALLSKTIKRYKREDGELVEVK